MTEKRSEYRKRTRKRKLMGQVKDAFAKDKSSQDELDVKPEFVRNSTQEEDGAVNREDYLRQNQEQSQAEKRLKLKRKLNQAILLVFVLIVLVLLALFYL